jgi:GT2 family glycosyltransferase
VTSLPPQPPQVRENGLSVSVVTFNTWSTTSGCLESISKSLQALAIPFEVLVLDNGTEQAPPDVRDIAGVRIGSAGQNLGYGRGHNWNLREAGFDKFLILNPDITVSAEAMSALLLGFLPGSEPRAPLLLNPDGSVQNAYRRLPDLSTEIGRSFGLDRRRGSRLSTLVDPPAQPTFIEQPAGAALLFSTADLYAAGGFDERFHMYFEDVDLCARLGPVLVLPDARFVHEGEGTAKNYRRSTTFWIERSRMVYHQKHRNGTSFALLRAVVQVGQAFRVLAHSAAGTVRPQHRPRARGCLDALVANVGIGRRRIEERNTAR